MTDDERQRQRHWSAYCLHMAEATHALADWCEEVEMMAAYIDLAAKWMLMAERPPPPRAPARTPPEPPAGDSGVH